MLMQYRGKAPTKELCNWLGLSRSSFYYKPTNGKRGFPASSVTKKADQSTCSNQAVVDRIRSILGGEFVCYGYRKITIALQMEDFIINHKKVYRLMGENNLLLGKIIKTNGKRQWVKQRRIEASKPMEYLCLDIKYVWVKGEKRFYYLLTILDVYSRKVLKWILQKSIRKMDVINLFREINLEHGIKGVNVRNDNGSQFIANQVRQFLRAAEANQEFTHIATPEENAYIEAYHSIVETEVIERFEFLSYYEAKLTITAYVDFYNNRRIHGSIKCKIPQKQWDSYKLKNSIFETADEAETGNAGEQPARINLPDGDEIGDPEMIGSPTHSSLSHMPEKTQKIALPNLYLLEESVQSIRG